MKADRKKPEKTSRTPWWNLSAHPAWAAALIVVATVLAYWPTLQAGFIWDDDVGIWQNPAVLSADGLRRIWCGDIHDYFPITWSMFWTEWRMFGMNPGAFHAVNVMLHVVGALLVFRVLLTLEVPAAWLAALLFAVHPVNVASVAWVIEGKNTLSLIFYAATVLFYLRPGKGWYLLSLATFSAALLCKTSGVLLPLALLGIVWWKDGRVSKTDLQRVVPYCLMGAAMAALTVWFQTHHVIETTVVRPEGALSRVAAAGWALWFDLYKDFIPLQLSMVYPRWSVDASSFISYLPMAAFAVGLVALWGFRDKLGRGPVVVALYFVLMLLPVLGVFDIYYMVYSLVADHWQYLAIIGVIAGTVAAADHLCPPRLHGAATVAGVGVAAVFAFLTWRQAAVYLDPETLWRATLAVSPQAWVAHHNLGAALDASDKVDEAMDEYRAALRLNPQYAPSHNNLARLLRRRNQVEEAIIHYQAALDLKRDYKEAHYNYAMALSTVGRTDEAIKHYQEAIRLGMEGPEVRTNLAVVLSSLGRNAEAIDYAMQAAQLDPQNPDLQFNLGWVLEHGGQIPEAIASYRNALQLHPGYERALARLTALQPAPNR